MQNKSQKLLLRELGAYIYKKRTAKKISRTQLAIELGTDEKQIRRIENGEVNATIISLLKICVALKIKPTDLFAIKIDEKITE